MRQSLLVAVALSVFAGCTPSISDAREGAARRSCDYEQRCSNIGSGQTFASFDECLTRRRSDYLSAWPTQSCEGKLNVDKLDVCFTAIENTQCNNGLDYLATLSKCTASEVCSAN